ncbi:MAG TPA: hypothetical protein VMY39_03845 [Planctomycetota bacterium]|nr:hypothetical protein [Planctomycetota bacterium]
MRKLIVLGLIVVLPAAGLFLGAWSGPLLARAHYEVRLADWVRLREAGRPVSEVNEVKAFVKSKREAADVIANAEQLEGTFRTGGAVLGAWCGLVFALFIFGFHRTRRREIYEIDYDACVACTRCFMSCPRERLRRRGDDATPETPLTGARP